MKQILPQAKCLLCGHEWTPRKVVIVECPRCKRYDWNTIKETEDDVSKYFGRHFDVAEEVKDANKH
jgi:Zn finger protein HypA/HybF involved in hydrogenase expression